LTESPTLIRDPNDRERAPRERDRSRGVKSKDEERKELPSQRGLSLVYNGLKGLWPWCTEDEDGFREHEMVCRTKELSVEPLAFACIN